MPERTFTITAHTADDPEQRDGRHPAVSCNVCGAWVQVLPDVEEGGDVGHFDDLGDFGTGVLSDHQQFVHNALSRWSQEHAAGHNPEEHKRYAAWAIPPEPQEVKL